MIQNNWWPEKWRPKKLSEYVGSEDMIDTIQRWIDAGEIPHLLFYSQRSGTGKTSIAKIIADSIDSDVLYINASDENNIETIRDKVKSFVSTTGFSTWKIVILDEFKVTPAGQEAMNNLMESYSAASRFILTTNFVDRILPSIKSRCTVFQVESPPKIKVALRLAHILDQERIEYEKADIVRLIDWYYPDQRIILNEAYRCSKTGKLVPIQNQKNNQEYLLLILSELNSRSDKSFTNIRQIVSDSKVRQFDDLFRFLFDSVEEFAPPGKRYLMIYHIAECQYRSAMVNDAEIQVSNMFATMLNDLQQ